MVYFEELELNKLYPRSVPAREGAFCELFHPHYNRLMCCLDGMDKSEIDAMQLGQVEVKTFYDLYTGALMLIFNFSYRDTVLTFDCPFSASLIPNKYIGGVLDSNVSIDEMDIELVVVDTAINRVVALDSITLSRNFTVELVDIMNRQREKTFDQFAADQWIEQKRQCYPAVEIGELDLPRFEIKRKSASKRDSVSTGVKGNGYK